MAVPLCPSFSCPSPPFRLVNLAEQATRRILSLPPPHLSCRPGRGLETASTARMASREGRLPLYMTSLPATAAAGTRTVHPPSPYNTPLASPSYFLCLMSLPGTYHDHLSSFASPPLLRAVNSSYHRHTTISIAPGRPFAGAYPNPSAAASGTAITLLHRNRLTSVGEVVWA